MWYKIDWDRLILLLLPTFLRKPVLFGYIKALIAPIASLHYKWEQLRVANLKKLSYNSQRCYLRGALNDIADPDQRRIYIDEVPELNASYLYQPEENLDYYLDTMFLDLDYTATGETVDFIVYVPEQILTDKKNEIIATLEFYKLAGKAYKILTI
ncbi:hypothetical protein [Flavobacterium sp. TAB 87]|uniref:hypothetical protein n=1 Tax=Flavobacterium sp. TAB 87 TaxID=1729581 RepID=UPI00076D825B|nr:hypothetical protein [Flavobacterium sp. TAB 87]KVV16147.1 hypothetical protein AP058_00312 [Flavobacterium sp. TAB 87]